MEKSQSKIAGDVVLLPPDEIMEKLIGVNQELLKTFDKKIVLNKEDCLPHISLAMGCIKKDDIPEIDTVLEDIAEKFSPITLTISDIPARTTPTGKKVSGFEIVKTKELQLLHETVMNKLSPYFTYNVSLDMIYALPNQQVEEVTTYWIKMYPKESSFEKFSPHITIGIGEVEGENIGLKFPTRFIVSKLALCHLGNYCTCRKILSSRDLKMKNKSPLVSIGMPVYNGEKYIRQALDSLLAQNFKDFELIISDNASTDSTAEICKMYASRDSRIRYHRNETNIGATANFNGLINMARGRYFMWAAHDDLWEPSFVSSLVEALENNPEAVLAFCHFGGIDQYNQQTYIFKKNWGKVFNHSRLWQMVYMISLGTPVSNSLYGLMRKDVLQKCGGMETRVEAYGADVLTMFHMLAYGSFTIVNKLLFHKRLEKDLRPAQELSAGNILEHLRRLSRDIRRDHKQQAVFRVLLKEIPLSTSERIVLFITTIAMEPIVFLANVKYYTIDILLLRIEREKKFG